MTSSENNQPPLLSVVIPVFNVGEWLHECLRSIQRQSFKNFEVIIVDDGSTDDSMEIAESFSAGDSRYSVHKFDNGGPGLARNRGLDLCRGSYVHFADSDDRIPPGAYQAMMSALLISGSDYVTAKAIDFYTDPDSVSEYWTTTSAVFDEPKAATSLSEHPELIFDHTVWNKVFSASFLKKGNIRFSEYTTCEDVFFSALTATAAKSIDVISDYVYEHRRRRGAISNALSGDGSMFDWAAETHKVAELIAQQPLAVQEMYLRRMLGHEALDRVKWINSETSPEVKKAIAGLVRSLYSLAQLGVQKSIVQAKNSRFRALMLETETLASTPEATPILSVVVPTHNVERWIDDCLWSIRRQDFSDMEILVVDDGSSDRTVQAIADHAGDDSRIRFFSSYGKGGGSARNIGIANARGEFLVFADGDDVVPKGAYRMFVEQLSKTQSDMAVADYVQMSNAGIWHPHWRSGKFRTLRERVTISDVPELILDRCCWDKMFRRSFWNSLGIAFPDVKRANDIAPITRAYTGAKTLDVVPGYSYVYRKRPGNTSMTAQANKPESSIGYLAQEKVCAELILASNASNVIRTYFDLLLRKDLWVHLETYLGSVRSHKKSQSLQVFAGAAALLRVVPASAFVVLEPKQKLIYDLLLNSQADVLLRLKPGSMPSKQAGVGHLLEWREALRVAANPAIHMDQRSAVYSRGVLNRLMHDWPKMTRKERLKAQVRLFQFCISIIDQLSKFESSKFDRVRLVLLATGNARAIRTAVEYSRGGVTKRIRQMIDRQSPHIRRPVLAVVKRLAVLSGLSK